MIYSLKYFITSIIFISSLFFYSSNFALNSKHYKSVEELIKNQKIIRIITDQQPGLGNQAASANLMSRLRQLGFKNEFEFIYPDNVTTKIISLFGLPKNIPAEYWDRDNNIKFIKLSSYVADLKKNIIIPVTLALTGGFRKRPSDPIYDNDIDITGLSDLQVQNFSNFMNSKIFVDLNNYPDMWNGSSIILPNEISPYPRDNIIPNKNTFFTMPVATFEDAKMYLKNNTAGQILIKEKPALNTLIKGIEDKEFNVLPVYGFPFQKDDDDKEAGNFPGNILQIIAAARHAILKGSNEMRNKPLIIPVFYHYDEEAALLLKLISSANWDKYEQPGAPQARSVINQLGLANASIFSTASLSDAKAIARIQALKPGQILLLSMGPLPKVVFDGLYTYTNSNVWAQIREGASSFDSLILSGRPHFRCRGDDGSAWEIGYDLISDSALKKRLEDLYRGGFCDGMSTWQNTNPSYQKLGDLLIEANNIQSAFSTYFLELKEFATKPNHDRILLSLEEALKIFNEN